MTQPPTLAELPPLEDVPDFDAPTARTRYTVPLAATPADEQTWPWLEGISVAWLVIALLGDVCARVIVGGSLRRGKPRVGDVELILAPTHPLRFKLRCERLLAVREDHSPGRFALRTNKLGHRIAWNDRYRAITCAGLPVDLFITQPDRQWGPNAVIRTGGHAANRCLVLTEGQKTILDDGEIIHGVLPVGMKFDDGLIWRDGVALDTPTERSVFEACGLPWIEPGLRSVEMYRMCARERLAGAEWRGRRMGDPPIPDSYTKFNGRWYQLEAAELLARHPALAAEVEALKREGEMDVVEQEKMF